MASILLIGDGRLATSLSVYLPNKGIGVSRWSRRMQASGACSPLWTIASRADVVLIAIRDDAIIPWTKENAALLGGKTLVHFSGALQAEGVTAMHPLYAFPPEVVPIRIMETIPFVCDDGGAKFGQVLPGLPNPVHLISPDQRALYHALAVLFGNLTTYLWNQTASAFWDEFGFPPTDLLRPYMASLQRNFEASPFDSLTGPVRRRDLKTVDANLAALETQPHLRGLYQAFVDAAWPAKPSAI